jgi:23S rRNA (guanosine2251-2'-O)-methyltransferase
VERRRLGSQRRQGRLGPIDLDDVVYGVHAVEEALKAQEPLRRIHVGDDRKRDPALRQLLGQAHELGVTVRFESRSFFSQFPYRAHQSVVAFGAPFDYVSLDEAIALRTPATPALYVVLDHITDPHNVGAILRTAECVGATAAILPERRSAGVNGTVRKAAAGATAHLPIARVANVAQALRSLKRAGIWAVGTTEDAPLEYTAADFGERALAVVIGAEDSGMSPVVRKECDYVVRISLAGTVPSLNASVAAGVVLFEIARQRAAARIAEAE